MTNIIDKEYLRNLGNGTLVSGAKKEKATEAFARLEMPNRKDEAWQKTDIKPLLATKYSDGKEYTLTAETENKIKALDICEKDAITMTFVNGVFAPTLSDSETVEGIVIKPMSEAKSEFSGDFENHFESTELHAENIFTALNTVSSENGLFVKVSRGKAIERPIHILNITDNENSASYSQTRNLIVAEQNSQAKIIESHYSFANEKTLQNVATETIVGENAGVEHYILQNEGENASQLNFMKVKQEAYSRFTSCTVSLNNSIIRNDVVVNHRGEGCETSLNGLHFGKESQHVDNHTLINHNKPHCHSCQVYKGIINDSATSSYFGMVHVARDAEQTNAEQSNHNILLSETAKAHSKPQLEIFTDDVKCSHGSTTGQLDKEALFYLRSRGIGLENARALLLHAFAFEALDTIKHEPYKEIAGKLVEKYMEANT